MELGCICWPDNLDQAKMIVLEMIVKLLFFNLFLKLFRKTGFQLKKYPGRSKIMGIGSRAVFALVEAEGSVTVDLEKILWGKELPCVLCVG